MERCLKMPISALGLHRLSPIQREIYDVRSFRSDPSRELDLLPVQFLSEVESLYLMFYAVSQYWAFS
jgi:hypothetical protein